MPFLQGPTLQTLFSNSSPLWWSIHIIISYDGRRCTLLNGRSTLQLWVTCRGKLAADS